MSRWQIVDGPHRQPGSAHDDFVAWIATIENANDPTERRRIAVEIPRTVIQSAPTKLLDEIRAAIETYGRAAIERFLDERDPPAP